MKIVNGEYLPPAYTPPTPPDNEPIDTSANDPTIEIELLSLNTYGDEIIMETKLINRDNVNLTFYAHAYTESNVPFYTLSETSVNRKSVLVNANSVTEHRFEFVQVVDNGSVVSVSQATSTTYYMYVFVTGSDKEEFWYEKALTINR